MDDLSQKIEAFLQSPDNLEKVRAAMASFANDIPPADAAPATDALPDLAGILPLLSGLSGDDENTALLRALRPHLHGGRVEKIDGAIQIMRLARLLPLLGPVIAPGKEERA